MMQREEEVSLLLDEREVLELEVSERKVVHRNLRLMRRREVGISVLISLLTPQVVSV